MLVYQIYIFNLLVIKMSPRSMRKFTINQQKKTILVEETWPVILYNSHANTKKINTDSFCHFMYFFNINLLTWNNWVLINFKKRIHL